MAKLAEYNVRRCIFAHDECRNTGKTNRNISNMEFLFSNEKNLIFFFFFKLCQIICKLLEKYKYAGQNLGQMKSTKKFASAEDAIKTVTDGWVGEQNDADMSYIEKYRHHDSG